MEDKEHKNEMENTITININLSEKELVKLELKLVEIFNKSKKKITESKNCLFLHPKFYSFNSNDYKPFFEYSTSFPLEKNKEYEVIYDGLNFIEFPENDNEKESKIQITEKEKEKEMITKIRKLFSYTKEKGIIYILLDEMNVLFFFQSFKEALGDNCTTKFFINFYFLESKYFFFLLSIQKVGESKTKIDLDNMKILITDYFTKQKMISSSTLSTINSYLKFCLYKMNLYRTQCFINYSKTKSLHQGEFYEIRLKSSPLIDDFSYIVTIYDNSSSEFLSLNNISAIFISYDISQEIIFTKQSQFIKMGEELKASRLIIFECAILNPLPIKELVMEVKDELENFRPDGLNKEISVKLWDDQSSKCLIYDNDNYLIRDCENPEKNLSIRQLFYSNDLEVIQNQIRTKLTSKRKYKRK